MAVEDDELYSNLNKLLADICKFLSDGTNYEKLSPYARKQADELITRSKKQLQEIAKVAECDGAYVDMERKSVNSEEDKNIIYSAVEEATVIAPQPVAQPQPQPNPYANLPAKDMSLDLKYGTLSWKCRIILKFEKSKRVYAGVHDNWFLLYSSEKDGKPIQSFDLRFHKAQAVFCKQNKNPTLDFELLSTLGDGKSFNFVARTHKDMLQWTSHINRCHENVNKSANLLTSDDDISETYDMIPEINNQENVDDDEEDIYHDIETYCPEVTINTNRPPDLPARRCMNIPLPPVPPVPRKESTSDSSDSSTYDPVITTSRVSLETKSSFSDEDEDDIYEPFVSKPIEVKPQINKLEQKRNESYIHNIYNNTNSSGVEKPKTPAKPKILPEKPRHFGSFKK